MAAILVIEDNEMLQKMYRRKLKEHKLQIVASGLKALELLEEGEFDLVISDGDLEDSLTGQDVWKWVRTNRPELLPRFLFCSGNIHMAKFCQDNNIIFHDKGADASELFTTVSEMLMKRLLEVS